MNVQVDTAVFLIKKVRYLTGSTYVLRFSRNGMQFTPGQHLVLGLPGSAELREYSIYSGIHDNFLEVLIRDKSGDFHGRLTDHLPEIDLDPRSRVYLCGNSHMIFDAMEILRARGIPQKQIYTEVYF